MDLATLIGFILAWGAVLFSMYHASEGAMGSYLKPPEMFLVLGGSVGAAMLSMPLHAITGTVSYLKKWAMNKDSHIEHIIKEMVQYAETARRDGVLALESVAREAPDPFLRRGLQLTIDGTDPEIIERILRIEIESMAERHKHGKHFFGTLAKFGPGFGLMATLHTAKPGGRAGRRKAAHAQPGGGVCQGDHVAGGAEHSGGEQPARRGDATHELPEQQTTGVDSQGGVVRII